MAKRICLLTFNETNCKDNCYSCGCGGETALNDCYVSIYDVQRVCEIVKHMADTSTEGEEICEFIRNSLERRAVVKSADAQPVKRGRWIRKEGYDPRDNFYYCSECNRIINVISGDSLSNYPYCHCGARMDGYDDDV